ncbi:hypothetical protein ABT369_14080 [Dactylosporangium sp. NPDC000244]|uniref:hypothetical protein n=1 Tax=Dactylosporangium sp. NPDC000244 TaxID=3154365 RepID=UPI00332866D4
MSDDPDGAPLWAGNGLLVKDAGQTIRRILSASRVRITSLDADPVVRGCQVNETMGTYDVRNAFDVLSDVNENYVHLAQGQRPCRAYV